MSEFINSLISRHAESMPAITPRLPGKFEAQVSPINFSWDETVSIKESNERGEKIGATPISNSMQVENNSHIVPLVETTLSGEIQSQRTLDLSLPGEHIEQAIPRIEQGDLPDSLSSFNQKIMMPALPIEPKAPLGIDETDSPGSFNEEKNIILNQVSLFHSIEGRETKIVETIKPKKEPIQVISPFIQTQVSQRNESLGVLPPIPSSTVVKISIGRIEVKAVNAASTNTGRTNTGLTSQPKMSLEDYLKRRNSTES